MVLILVDQITNRIDYAFDFIFKERGVPYELTTSFIDFDKRNEVRKLNYSSKAVEKARQIKPSLLLRESSVIPLNVEKSKFSDQECLSFDGSCDIVASVFFVLTRYEEYGNVKDPHGRFSCNYSILKKFNWIETAICDRWSKAIIEFIDPDLYIDVTLTSSLLGNDSKLVPTFDIDNTYAYKFKSGKRKFLSTIRDLLKFDFRRLKERSKVNAGGKDPYDTFDRIMEIANRFPTAKLFWLVESNGSKDRNLDLGVTEHRNLIQQLSDKTSINLHPSYDSYTNGDDILIEKEKLEKVINSNITSTRQHFLRFKLPQTFQELISVGIKDEYSMGFPERAGFRCGTARAHQWFNLLDNSCTDLMIHPFVYMDGTLNEYMKLSIEESKKLIHKLFEEVKEHGGEYIFIWHNETIGEYKKWKGWSEVLDYTLNLSK